MKEQHFQTMRFAKVNLILHFIMSTVEHYKSRHYVHGFFSSVNILGKPRILNTTSGDFGYSSMEANHKNEHKLINEYQKIHNNNNNRSSVDLELFH